MTTQVLEKLPLMGKASAPILVVCDPPPGKSWAEGRRIVMYPKAKEMFLKIGKECGFAEKDFLFVCPCPPIPEEIEASDKRITDFVAPYRDRLLDIVAEVKPMMIIYLGKWAGRLTMGRAVQITKARGSIVEETFASLDGEEPPGMTIPVLPMLSPGHVLRRPENYDIFRTDFLMAQRLRDEKYNVAKVALSKTGDRLYEWKTDIQFLLDKPPAAIAADTETTGLKWWTAGTNTPDAVKTLTVQICYAPGKVAVCPVDCDYYPITAKQRAKLVLQIKSLLENPKVRKTGHNIKYDTHILREDLGIYVENWTSDTQLLAFVVDENMQEKSLDECVRRWVPEMAGYNDDYNQRLDKSDMRSVSHEDMLGYGGGDADASYRLAAALTQLAKADKKQFRCYEKIILPAIKAFADPVEFFGIKIDTAALSAMQHELAQTEEETYESLIAQVPPAIKRRHLIDKNGNAKRGKDADKALSFTRDAFTRDILFSKQGLGLKPQVFTATTARLAPALRIPSVSTKQHLPYFSDEPFVAELMEYVKLQKIRSTYVGVPFDEDKQAPTGFWQYIYNGEIHPSFILHRTVTGRTASNNPNSQNFPKRGKLAKAYRKIFIARPGYVLIETDLSQAELRIAAWMAGERTMLKIYKDGGDIHAMTAAHTMGLSLKQFQALDEEVIEQKRFQAKAINFGFIYGMWWRKFKAYAKTDYGLEFTDKEAEALREGFFDLYPGLEEWHLTTREWVRERGYVRALHGAIRHLPSIKSDEDYIRQECERQAINAPVQRFASDLGLIAMVRLVRDADPDIIRPLMFVHDALVIEVKEEYAEKARGWIKFYMETPPLKEWFGLNPPLPILADIAQGPNLGEMEKFKKQTAFAPDWFNPAADAAA